MILCTRCSQGQLSEKARQKLICSKCAFEIKVFDKKRIQQSFYEYLQTGFTVVNRYDNANAIVLHQKLSPIKTVGTITNLPSKLFTDEL